MTGLLLWRLYHTTGRHESGMVTNRSFKVRSRTLLYLAAYNLLGQGSLQRSHGISVMRGVLPDNSDSLWNAVSTWRDTQADTAGLPREKPKCEYFGTAEAIILIRRLDQIMLERPARAAYVCQLKAFIQLLLVTGIRPSSAGLPNSDERNLWTVPVRRMSPLHAARSWRILEYNRLQGDKGLHASE